MEITPSEDRIVTTGTEPAVFLRLPAYAAFIRDELLEDFARSTLEISREQRIPLLQHFESVPERELIEVGMKANRLLLDAIIEDRLAAYIEESLRSWKDDGFSFVQGYDIVIEDVSKVNFVRRKVFRDFLPRYTHDIGIFIAIMEEVDRLTLMQEDTSYKTLFEIKERKILEHHYFIDKINNASPGTLYVYELKSKRQVYLNHKLEALLGYSQEEIQGTEPLLMDRRMHPADRAGFEAHLQNHYRAADSELCTFEFRILNSEGRYIWQRAYETVFRRDASNAPLEIIGVALDISQEKESSLKLEIREQQLEEAQEIAEMGSFEWDLQGGESIYSPYLLHIFEMEKHTSLPDFLNYVHPGDLDMVKRAIVDALNGKEIYECEYRYRKKGPEKVIWARGKVVFQEGKPCKLKGTVMDVTKRHDMLKKLARSEELHKQAQALTSLGNWSWSLVDNRVDWSDEMYRIFGLPPQSEEMTLDKILLLVHPDDRDSRRKALHDGLSSLRPEDYFMRVLGPGDTIKYIEGKTEVLCDDHGHPYKMAGTCQDVTISYLLNERLKENEEASRQLINSAPEAIVVIDEESKIQLWNPKAAAIFGWTNDEILGMTLMETIIPPAHRYDHFRGIRRLKATGQSKMLNRSLELEALKKNGQVIDISLNISRSVRAGRTVYIAFIRDITEEKSRDRKLELQRNELAEKNLALERSNQELTSFNYIASHDLKEPVRKIKMFANLIAAREAELPGFIRDSMTRIRTAADHMERLIEALIVFSRTDTGDRVFEKIDLRQVVDRIVILMKDPIDELGAVIGIGILPEISGIPFQVEQLFENVIGNALKYSRKKVAPIIDIHSAEVRGGSIGDPAADPARSYHRVSVSDNGIGFEQQYAGKVFEVFERLHGKENYTGTGIGLAICKKIVQQHEGFIMARSEPGAGSTFEIFLPAAEEH